MRNRTPSIPSWAAKPLPPIPAPMIVHTAFDMTRPRFSLEYFRIELLAAATACQRNDKRRCGPRRLQRPADLSRDTVETEPMDSECENGNRSAGSTERAC